MSATDRRLASSLLVAFLALLLGLGLALQPSTASAAPKPVEEPRPADGMGVIYGQVRSSLTDGYLNGVTVQALDSETQEVVTEDLTGDPSEIEPSGYFELHLPPGNYEVSFDPTAVDPALALASYMDTPIDPDTAVLLGDVELTPPGEHEPGDGPGDGPTDGPTDDPTDGPSEPLTAPVPDEGQAVIWGLVRKAGGYRLLGDVKVQAFPVDGDGEPEATSLTYGGYGYRNGVFALYVAPGTYDLRVTAPAGSEREDLQIGPVTVVADQVAFKGALKLPYPPGFLVKVSGFDGSRVDGAFVQLIDHQGRLVSSGDTRAGRVHFGDVPPTGSKRYRLVVTKPGFTESVSRVRYDGTSKETSVKLRRAPVPEAGSAVIWGVVRSAGDRRFPQNVTVQAFEVGGADTAAATSLTYGGYGFRGGVFALDVPPGEYRVTIVAPDGSDRADLELTRSVAADESADLGFLTLPRLPGVSVRAIGLHPRQRIEGATVRMTGPQGEAYEGVTGGDGRVRFAEATARGYYEIEVSAAGFDTSRSGVSIRRKDRAKRNVYLWRAPIPAPGASVIWGVIRKAGPRTGLGNVEVAAVPTGGDEPAATSLTYGGYGFGNGVFALYVPPGEYSVRATAPEGSGREDLDVGPITATPDAVLNLGQLRLRRSPGIRVRVLNGMVRGPVQEALVQVTGPNGEDFDALTGPDGRALIEGELASGRYDVLVTRAGFTQGMRTLRVRDGRGKTRVYVDPQPVAAEGDSVIWGVIRRAGGRFVGDALVQAIPVGADDAAASSLTYEGYGYRNGVFALYVPSGDYLVRVTPPDGTTGEVQELGPFAVESDEVRFVGIRKLPLESLEVVAPPAITPSTGLVEGGTVSVTPATYSNESVVASRSYEWFAVYTYDCGQLEDCSYRYQFARGAATEVTLPAFVEGARILVVETARTAKGARLARSQSQLTGIVRGLPELVATTPATFGSTPTQGQPTSPGGVVWNVVPDEVSYRWSVDGRSVASSDARLSSGGASFTPAARDVGAWLSVEIVATKAGYTPGYAYAYASRIKGVDERIRVLRVNLTMADGPDAGTEDDPVTQASLWLCGRDNCYSTDLRNGVFESEVPTSQSGLPYELSVYPFASSLLGTTRTVSVENGDVAKTVTIKLEGVQPAPPSVTFPPSAPTRGEGAESVPMGFIGAPLTPFTATGCTPVDNPSWTVTFANGADPMTGNVRPGDVEPEVGTNPATVAYTVRIPELTNSGHATITTNFTCGVPISFTIYIDPSGYVTDQFGRTIAGAEVTLLRANPGASNFTVVADRNAAVMDPAVNDRNPSTTDGTGFFRWDVTEGDYRVSVTRASSGGAACAVVTTPTMAVPPIRVDLLIKTECAGAMTPEPTTAPAVGGTREVGRTLSVSTGRWANGIVQTGIQWLRNGNPIEGATGSQYTLVQADAGQQVTAQVTARRPDYVQENGSGALVSFTPFTSPATGGGAVTAANPGNPGGGGGGTPTPTISNTAKPTIAGTAKVGGSLTAEPGTWSTTGLTFAYQWMREGTPIVGATGAEYAPALADLYKAITVRVTASKTGSTPGTATSEPVTVGKGAAPENTGAKPLVTGTPEVGETLTVSNGGWDTEGLTFAYQWLRDGEPIEGATAATYVVTEDDLGALLTADVTATKEGYEAGTSRASGVTVLEPVEPAPSTTKATLLGGKVKQGDRGEVRVKVTSEGDSVPTGTLTIRAGRKTLEVELVEADGGRVRITLPKLKPGKHPVKVEYSGDDLTEGSSDRAGTLKVTEKKKGKKGKGKRTGGGRPMAALV